MEFCTSKYPDVVARLKFCRAASNDAAAVHESWYVAPNDQFDIGRHEVLEALKTHEPTISIHHLRFRCVVFDENEVEDPVAPMVYVKVLSSNSVALKRAPTTGDNSTCLLTKNEGDVLLNHHDLLQLSSRVSIRFDMRKEDTEFKPLDDIRRAEVERFAEKYAVTPRLLGTGGFAQVYVALQRSNGRQLACKIVALPYRTKDKAAVGNRSKQVEQSMRKSHDQLFREFEILQKLDHPNIVRLEKVFQATYNLYIFQELVTGGDLLSYLASSDRMNEAEAAAIVRQLLKAVDYLHSNGIAHRDIKPENILMTSWRPGARIVLTDFGQARSLVHARTVAQRAATFRMRTQIGTLGYTAPEVYKHTFLKDDPQHSRGYSKAIDMWSVGCVTASLLIKELAFVPETFPNQSAAMAAAENYDLKILDEGKQWRNVSRKAKSFVKACLTFEEKQRMSAQQALLHVWFTHLQYASEFDALYERATSDWRPRGPVENIVEFVETTDVVAANDRPDAVKKLADEAKSRYFVPAVPPFRSTMPPNSAARPRHTDIPSIEEDNAASRVAKQTRKFHQAEIANTSSFVAEEKVQSVKQNEIQASTGSMPPPPDGTLPSQLSLGGMSLMSGMSWTDSVVTQSQMR